MVAQAVVEKIPLPFHPQLDRHKLFPMGDERFHPRITRESDDGVQMIGHKQAEATVPDQFFVVVYHRGNHALANADPAKLVFARRPAFGGDEKAAAFGHPWRSGVRQLFTDGQIHGKTIMKSQGEKKARRQWQGAQSFARRRSR